MKYWKNGHWETGERIIPNEECDYVVELIQNPNSSIVDLCCGDGNILERIKDTYPTMECIGIDLFIDNFKTKNTLLNKNITLYKESIDTVIQNKFLYLPKDYIVMRNTFGTEHISHLNRDLEIEIFKHFRYFICQRPPENHSRFKNYYADHILGKLSFSNETLNIKVIKENKYYYLIESYENN